MLKIKFLEDLKKKGWLETDEPYVLKNPESGKTIAYCPSPCGCMTSPSSMKMFGRTKPFYMKFNENLRQGLGGFDFIDCPHMEEIMKISNKLPDAERHYIYNLISSGLGEIPDSEGKVSAKASHKFIMDGDFIIGTIKIVRVPKAKKK